VIEFDEVIDEMPGSGTQGGLSQQVLLSPVSGGVRVSWHRSKIHVKPREGWKKRTYRLEVLPGIFDLRRNRFDTAKVVMFTTGPAIGQGRIGGIVLSWTEQRILPRALIEAVPLPDSVGYLTRADSGGQFNLEGLPTGQYIVYALLDENNDRRRGVREPWDSTLLRLDSSSNVALYTFGHDTNPPRLRAASFGDSVSIRLEFSQPLDPALPIDTSRVRVLELPDSTPVPIARVMSQRLYDSLATAARQKADSARAAAAAARDTSRRLQPPPPPPQPPPTPAQQKQPVVDTALVRRLLSLRPVPTDRMVVILGKPLKPETRYLIRVTDATNLIGKKGAGDVLLLVPKPVVRDTTNDARRTPPR
jgi:hypothetical protein